MSQIRLIYEQVRDSIQKEALAKKPGESLNSEVYYASHFAVSRPTVRKAVDELVNAGVVKRIPGKGLSVADKNCERCTDRPFAIVLPYTPDDGFFYSLITGCIDIFNSRGYGYAIFHYQKPEEKLEICRRILSGSYLGVIMPGYDKDQDIAFLEELKKQNVPFVLVDNPIEGYDSPYVISDDYNGSYKAAEYLIRHGHKKILYLNGSLDIYTLKQRKNGYRDALKNNNIDIPENYIISLSTDEEINKRLPEIGHEYTAICGYSDLPVIMAYNKLAEMNIDVPLEVSLLGYGNFKTSGLLKVPLTTVSIPVYDMGLKAASMLLDHYESGAELGKIILEVELIERKSVRNVGIESEHLSKN